MRKRNDSLMNAKFDHTLQEIGIADVFDALDRIDGMNALQQITVLGEALSKKAAATFPYETRVQVASVLSKTLVKSIIVSMELAERRRRAGDNGG